MERLTLTRPDDWHLHLRDGAAMADVVAHSARVFARAIVMPNLKPPVTAVADIVAYRRRIEAALGPGTRFEPLMTLYLTDNTSPDEVRRAIADHGVAAVKLYPAGATTNSDSGVTDIGLVEPVLDVLAELGTPLLIHGEVTDEDVDVFDREKAFIDRVLAPLVANHGGLRVVLEHVTTSEAVDFVEGAREGVAATITPHHLMMNRNAIFAGGLRPHHYCLPVLKRECHRRALTAAATSANPRFFLGTDSAPHAIGAKESSCGCAGIFSAHAALEFCAEVFEREGALEKLEGFVSHFGADFYRLPRNTATVTLARQPWTVPETLSFGSERLVPMGAGGSVSWRLEECLGS